MDCHIIQTLFIKKLVEIPVKGSRKNSGQRKLADSKIPCHLFQGNFITEMSGYVGHGLIDDIVTLHAAFLHQAKAGNTPCQKNLHVSLFYHKAAVRFFPADPETAHRIYDITMNILFFSSYTGSMYFLSCKI